MIGNKEVIWKGHDNSVDLQLFSNDSAVDLSPVSEMRVVFDDSVVVKSTDSAVGSIKWNQSGYSLGEIRISAGTYSCLSTGVHIGTLVVYDGSNPNGIIWDDVPFMIRSAVTT
jgi:hypothetical protein